MKTALLILGVITLVAGCCILGAHVFQWLWNFVVPAVFKGPEIGFWHSAAIVALLWFVGGFFKTSSKSE
jgi:hypothetical protein